MVDENSSSTDKLDRLKAQFKELEPSDRLETLLEYSELLPELPKRFQLERNTEDNRVHECQTPVYLWIEVDEDKLGIYADVPRDSPTVRGFISLMISILSGGKPSEALSLNSSLLRELGLAETLGMIRTQGLQGVLRRIKSEVQRAVE